MLVTILGMNAPALAHDSNCDNSATDGSPIHCEEGSTSTDDISIDVDSIDIDTTADGDAGRGVAAIHEGSGDITIDIGGTTSTPSTIDTTGAPTSSPLEVPHGIAVRQIGTGGDTTITAENTTITTTGLRARGISVQYTAAAGSSDNDLKITLGSGTSITTGGHFGSGVYGYLTSNQGVLDVDLLDGSSITTKGVTAHALELRHGLTAGNGNLLLDLTGTSLETQGASNSHGVFASHSGATGNIEIRAPTNGGSITTKGRRSSGIHVELGNGTGDIIIDLKGLGITTESTGATAQSYGVYAWHKDTGNTDIDLRGGFVKTNGEDSYGLYARHFGKNADRHGVFGNIDIATHDNHAITTTGPDGHGIVADHNGTKDTDRQIDILVGGPITVSGAGAQGVRIGDVNSDGVPSLMAALDGESYRLQKVTVNNRITSAGAGVFLANGGRVIIGPRGSITSDSGIAILATGTVPEVPDDTNTPGNEFMAAIPPKLYVDLDLNGRRVSQVIGDDWIINDGGQTTIKVNDVMLHEGSTGVALDENGDPLVVANGAWDVHMVGSGTNVTNYTDDPMTMDVDESDPMHWTKAALTEGVAADRDFSAADFTETRVRCPAGQSGFPNCRRPSPPPEPAPEPMQVNEEIVADEDEMAAVHIEGDGSVRIGAQGSLRAASGIAILASGTTPELTVDLDLDGRTVSQVIGDDWIINDGGGTTINVNGVTLHDATTGVVPGAVAPNGAYNTRVNDEVRIRAEGVRVLDRSDPDPANWRISDPEEGVIADRDFSAADFIETADGVMPQPPMFIEEYAPRAAVYEALPSVLLGLQERTLGPARTRQPTWLTVTGHTGSQDFDRSSVGIEYDMEYFQAEAGKHFTLASGTEAWATLQYLDGTAEVGSPVQGGDIDVQGIKLALALCRGCTNHAEKYVLGEVSLGHYDLDLDSDTRGNLKSGVGATSYALALEAGRRLQQGTYILSPRLRLEHASVSIDRFTDAVDCRVSYPDTDRLAIALGVRAETAPNPQNKGGLSLWSSLDLEHRLDDAQTTARVSGTRLKAETGDHSILVGLGASWQRDRLRLNAGLSAREGLDGASERYGASLDLSLQF